MGTHSLPVRHRPRKFADVAGQKAAVSVLSASGSLDNVPQQYLLAGPSGTGKTTLARIFVAALFCENKQKFKLPLGEVTGVDACGSCSSCVSVTGPGGRHPDVIEIDAASHGGVDQVRTLAEQAHLAPLQADRRIYIIDEAHGLTKEGGQAFLKLLEEPPVHTMFLLATTDPQKLPTALKGRCVQVFVETPTTEELVENLQRVCALEHWQVPAQTLDLVVGASDLSLGVRGTVATLEKLAVIAQTGSLVTQDQAALLLGQSSPEVLKQLTDAILKGDKTVAVQCATKLSSQGAGQQEAATNYIIRWAHGQLQQAASTGQPLDLPLWWLEKITDPTPWPLVVTVARMASPSIGGAEGLGALVARAETLAQQLEQETQTTGATPAPVDQMVAARPVEVPSEIPQDLAAQELAAFLNLVAKHGGAKAALAVRRGSVKKTGNVFLVTLPAPDESVTSAVASASTELGVTAQIEAV